MLTKYIKAFMALKHETWYSLDMDDQEKTLQTIVEYYSRLLGTEQLAQVKIRDFYTDVMAQYNPKTNEISIRKDLVTRGVIEMVDGCVAHYEHPTNRIFFYLAHEIKHAMQHYYLMHPEACKDNDELELIKINQKHIGDKNNSYFVRDMNRADGLSIYTHYLYMLQPVERYAWEFAYKQIEDFKNMMHEIYPDDRAFTDVIVYSDFLEVCKYANAMFNSKDALLDIDTLLRVINGDVVERKLNDVMCAAIKLTQESHMYNNIKWQLAREIKETIEPIEELQIGLEADISDADVAEMFEDYERK
jgi:hypothetical protein